MKILIVNNMAPFIWGGAEELAVNLQKNLLAEGHEAEILRIPFQYEPSHIPSQMLMVRSFKLTHADRVIALKFPAYLIPHHSKTLWLLHQYRQAYDLYDSGQSNLIENRFQNIRKIIKNADDQSFRECRKIFTNSEVTQQRLLHYNKFPAEVLHPPLNDPELFSGGTSDGYIFAGGRINDMKRQYLLLKALKLTPKNIKLIIAGPADQPKDAEKLTRLVENLNLTDRVKLDMRFLAREELANYVNHATACAYLPFDEDSLGYVAMEAATAGKAIISCTDSGGILGLVKHLQTGWAADPEPESLANAMVQATSNLTLTKEMGVSARQLWMDMGINWPNTIKRLLS